MKTRRLSLHGWILVALASGNLAWLAPRSKALASTLSTDATFEDLLVALLGLVALVASAWFLTVAAALLAGSPHAWLRIVCPTFLGALLITAQQGAHAAEVSLDGLRLPDRPVSALRIDMPPPRATASSETVVVRTGDSLWAIAAHHLGGQASNADIAHACRAWHRSNLRVIGSDPDIIQPGMRLRAPALPGTS